MYNILLHMIFNIDHAHNLMYLWKQLLYMDWFTAYVTLFIKKVFCFHLWLNEEGLEVTDKVNSCISDTWN